MQKKFNDQRVTDAIDVANVLAEHQGVSVITVDDGWVFTFKTSMLESLLKKSEASGKAIVFIQRSDLLPKN